MFTVTMRVRHGDVDATIERTGDTIAQALADLLDSDAYGVGYGPTTQAAQDRITAALEDDGTADHGWADYRAAQGRDAHGAGICTFDSCADCQHDESCPNCGAVSPLQTSRIAGDVTRRCTPCGITYM